MHKPFVGLIRRCWKEGDHVPLDCPTPSGARGKRRAGFSPDERFVHSFLFVYPAFAEVCPSSLKPSLGLGDRPAVYPSVLHLPVGRSDGFQPLAFKITIIRDDAPVFVQFVMDLHAVWIQDNSRTPAADAAFQTEQDRFQINQVGKTKFPGAQRLPQLTRGASAGFPADSPPLRLGFSNR